MNNISVIRIALSAAFLFAIGQSHAELPPEAQEAMKKGLIAAKQQDYLLAIRYFQDARKKAPDAAEIFYNLGLAESKIPGRELRAICWFGAYLAANPNAPNADAVKDQIDALNIKSQSNNARLIKFAEETAQLTQNLSLKELYLGWVAGLWAESGDITAAQKAANSIHNSTFRDEAYDNITRGQIAAGDIEGARKTVNLIQTADSRKKTQELIDDQARKTPGPIWQSVSDWLNASSELDSDLFLDLSGYLKAVAASDNPQKLFTGLQRTAEVIVREQNRIDYMLEAE